MSIVPNIEDDPKVDDLCWQCGMEVSECVCGGILPDDFDPLNEDSEDPDWDDYENDLGESHEDNVAAR